MTNSVNRFFVEKLGGTTAEQFVGNVGEVFYDPALGALSISDGVTVGGIPIPIHSGALVYDHDIIPTADNTFNLGSDLLRWKSVHIGPGTLFIQDQNDAGLNAELTVVDGVLKINGANQLQVGQLKFVDNTIESETGEEDIQIGLLTSPANLVLNRNVVMGEGKTFNTTGLTSLDPTADITLGASSDTGQLVTYREIVLKDGNDNVLMQIQNEDGVGKLKFNGGSQGIWYDGGVVINGVGYHSDYYGIQPMSYNSSTGQVTYGQLNYAHFQGFPRLPNFSSDTAANTAIAGQTVGGDFYNTPQRGQMYYNTTTDKAMVYTASGWQAMN